MTILYLTELNPHGSPKQVLCQSFYFPCKHVTAWNYTWVNFKLKELKIGLEAEKLGFLLVIELLQL